MGIELTTNYELIKPKEATEASKNWVPQWRSNADKVDSKLKEFEDRISYEIVNDQTERDALSLFEGLLVARLDLGTLQLRINGGWETLLYRIPSVEDESDPNFTFNSTLITYGGQSEFCGVAFVAPPTGAGTVLFSVRGDFTAGAIGRPNVIFVPIVRTGDTIGSGSNITSTSVDYSLQMGTHTGHSSINQNFNRGSYRSISGLTPGNSYNVSLMHKVNHADTTFRVFYRQIKWVPEL